MQPVTQTNHQQDQQQENRALLEAAIQRWRDAFAAKHSAGLVADYAPNAVMFDCKPPYALLGANAIKEVWDACMPFFPAAHTFTVEHRDTQLHIFGDSAVYFGLVKPNMPNDPDHPACRDWLRFTVCYAKIDGAWKVVHEHVSLPYNPMTDQVAPITDPADLMCGVVYPGM